MDAVELRPSNVSSWTGFAAAMFAVLCIVLWGELMLQPYQGKQLEEVKESRASVDEAKRNLSNITRNGAQSEFIERAKAFRTELDDS